MNNSVNRSVGFESVPFELLAIAVGLHGQSARMHAQASLYAYADAPIRIEPEYEPDYSDGCLGRGFVLGSGMHGFDF